MICNDLNPGSYLQIQGQGGHIAKIYVQVKFQMVSRIYMLIHTIVCFSQCQISMVKVTVHS